MRFAGKVGLVTGGASGLGLAVGIGRMIERIDELAEK